MTSFSFNRKNNVSSWSISPHKDATSLDERYASTHRKIKTIPFVNAIKVRKNVRIKDVSSLLLGSNAMNLTAAIRQKPILVGTLIEAMSMTTMTKRSESRSRRGDFAHLETRSTLSRSSLSSFKLSIVAIS